ncbi:LLM class flavin-dependent oxidoreductase [Krasilnikoviella flava]|uniref:Flavin-dependent oxidoreductase, luciferase family (Includes alkanesulfonate monooxygenase SsuD and methylene tetrahydromethanopterin reductase) n=1 Tax=Krasilnikoviella flava TaxID=526729 RepID=A0A1T5LIU1_9MICO|nr:LLM class flavin-dependent oxidoreductase [Krasilnikoviella flava]SKC75897.1 Flavin-dependent oxidoreductase, luciferase family (includes alkanesulfonate monooxygenase SsuD and methylene tetrahydromethanopterin reductase) [Krasilnikoviella flava]
MTVTPAPRPEARPAVRLGIAFVPTMAPESLRSLATAAEAAGLDDLWVWEDCFKQSGVASATAALAWTARIRVGLGLMPAPLRSTAGTAMELATVARMFPGRFVPAVGHGVQEWMEQAGVRVKSPLTLLREHADALRRLLAGEEVTTSGRYVTLDHVRLDWPAPQVPLVLGGVGPRSLALAGELGDGVILANALTPDDVRAAAETAGGAAQAAGRPAPGVYATLIAATGDDAQQRLDAELPLWGAEPGRGIGAAGDARAIADGVLRLAAAGASAVAVQPTADEPDLAGFVELLGREVRPLLDQA